MPTPNTVAREIAEQIARGDQPRTWRKVTTLLSGYGAYRLTTGVRERIAQDFATAGLELSPSIFEVSRDGTVRISSAAGSSRHTKARAQQASAVTAWRSTSAGWVRTEWPCADAPVTLVDIDVTLVDDRDALTRSLTGRLPGLTTEAMKDLLEPDPHASFKLYRVNETAKRASLMVAMVDEGQSTLPDKSVPLTLGLVELALGDGWLITARHHPTTYVGGSSTEGSHESPSPGAYHDALIEHGLARATTADEAAAVVISQGVESFSRVRGMLASYVESRRNDFARGSRDRSLLVDLQATLPLVVSALEPLLRPNVTSWLTDSLHRAAGELSAHVQRNYEALRELQGTIAAAVSQADQAQNEEYQRSLATLGALLLAPALIASIFGANTMLQDTPAKLVWLIVAMVVAGVGTQLYIRKRFGPRRTRATRAAGAPSVRAGARPSYPQSSAPAAAGPDLVLGPAVRDAT